MMPIHELKHSLVQSIKYNTSSFLGKEYSGVINFFKKAIDIEMN